MAEKLWLIRTTKKQILGPVSREKVIELIEKTALTEKDEISRGNGYWFHIRERDLLDKYLYGDIHQEFNPISEAPDVLTSNSSLREGTGTIDRIPGLAKSQPVVEPKPTPAAEPVAIDDETLVPSEDDLEYPDMGGDSAPQKLEGADGEEILLPSNDDLDYPDFGAPETKATPVATPAKTKAPEKEEVVENVVMGDDGEEIHLPSNDDLEYPDMGESDMTATTIEVAPELDLTSEEEDEVLSVPEESDLDYPEVPEQLPPQVEAAPVVSLNRKATPSSAVAKALEQKRTPPTSPPKPAVIEEVQETEEVASSPVQVEEELVEIEEEEEEYEEEDDDEEEDDEEEDEDLSSHPRSRGVRIKRTYDAPARNDRYLFALLAFVLLVLATGIIYYYSKILGKPLPFIDGVFVSDAHAQTTVQTSSSQVETSNLSKKKIFLS